MYAVRLWCTEHARFLRRIYVWFAKFAPLFRPLARVLGERRLESVLRVVEKPTKQFFFDCQMCGQCVLSATGMACPMNCPKEMRNGPCGGVRPDGGCEVKPEMRCVWVEATAGTKLIVPDHQAHPTPLLPAIDQRRHGQSSWIRVVHGQKEPAFQAPQGPRSLPEADESPLEAACRSGQFVVTVELAPPDSANPRSFLQRAERFRGLVDAINVTDGPGGNCHMSSVAASAVLAAGGFNPVYQITCRDRNRIAIQGDVLGAAALGVNNILCLTGDDVSQGDHPQAKPVFDLDSVSLIHIVRGMVDHGQFASGRPIEQPPRLFIGATANPFVPPFVDRVANLEKKILAGARFIQTQFCFDVGMFEEFMQEVRRRGLHRKASIIVGVGTLSTAKALRWMGQHVPGVVVPEAMLRRIEGAGDQAAAARDLCVETIHAVRAIEGVAGVHVMGHRNEASLVEIISRVREA